jgi:hypothetical protein
VFRGTWAIGAGVLTRSPLRSSAWRRLREDVYADASLPDVHRPHPRGACLVMPRGAAPGGRTAADLLGVRDLVGPGDPVEVVLPPGTRWHPQPGLAVRSAPLAGGVAGTGAWLRWTTGLRTAVDLARREPGEEAVVLLDRMVNAGVVDLAAVRTAVAAPPRCRGVARARLAAVRADGRAESPQETRVRLLIRAAGLPVPVAQYVVKHRGRFVARVDFAWPQCRLALEHDGQWHADPGQFARDRERLNRLTAAGWRVVFATAGDVHRPAALLARLRDELA